MGWQNSLWYLLKISILLVAATAVGYLYFRGDLMWSIFALLILIPLAYYWLNQERRVLNHIREFADAVHYRDFTRRYPSRKKNSIEAELFHAFNDINRVFHQINSEKEIQHQYLSKVINMLDMALIFYETESGKVVWINDAFKQLFGTPHIVQMRGLEKRLPDLYRHTVTLPSGQQQMELVPSTKGEIKLLIQASTFDTKDGKFRIVSYQNVNEAIDQTETKAWHKLLRVLTHEIMNSIAPITSLAETLHQKLERMADHEEIEDVKVGVATIQSRSKGLIQFAKSYRLINQVDQPHFQEVSILQLFNNIHQLLEPTLLQKNIELDTVITNTRIVLSIDQNLIEQVLINIILNAMDAVKDVGEPYIGLQVVEVDGRVQIRVKDNGVGIPEELRDQIFTPFFTTKKSGNGIGLTLSKQIMLLHGGNIFLDSEPGKGTTVRMQF